MAFAPRRPYCAQDDNEGFTKSLFQTLLRDCAAGDAISGSSGWIGLVIVCLGVDDDCGASVAEERVRVGAESDVLVLDLRIGFALGVDGEVFHVAGVMAFGIVESVLFGFGIEVRTGGFEIRRIAFGILMKVNSVLARGKAVKMQLEGNG